jgi:hypothetical protein
MCRLSHAIVKPQNIGTVLSPPDLDAGFVSGDSDREPAMGTWQ